MTREEAFSSRSPCNSLARRFMHCQKAYLDGYPVHDANGGLTDVWTPGQNDVAPPVPLIDIEVHAGRLFQRMARVDDGFS